ncbi:MAG: efflux RND transporter periplasmic adaptor subunit [Planctomycetes bacterium]|nr:efflux RND transporter periplasmic adaptor subunit [Planctomycetota bacterium]
MPASRHPFQPTRTGLTVLAFLLAFSLSGTVMAKDKQKRRERVVPVEVFKAITEDIIYTEETTGTLLAGVDVDVRSEIDGIVQEIFFEEGDRVKKGDLLVTMDDSEYRYKELENEGKVLKARADLSLALKTFDRMENLHKEGVISSQDYDIAEADVELKEASLKSTQAILSFAKDELNDTRIHAPITGIVSEKFIDVGEYVTEGSTDLLNIIDIDPIKLEFTVPAKYFSYVKVGQEVSVSVEAYPDEEFTGSVYYINPKIAIDTRRFKCYARIQNPDGRLSPGFFVITKLPVATHLNAVVIPEEALLSEEGVNYCFLVEDGLAVRTVVVPGMRLKDGMLEIVKGLKAGDSVVVRGQYVLSGGEKVDAKPFVINERD